MRSNKSKRRMLFLCIAILLACASPVAYRTKAAVLHPVLYHATQAERQAHDDGVLYGKRLVAFGGYELNATFAPDGTIYCIEFSAMVRAST